MFMVFFSTCISGNSNHRRHFGYWLNFRLAVALMFTSFAFMKTEDDVSPQYLQSQTVPGNQFLGCNDPLEW